MGHLVAVREVRYVGERARVPFSEWVIAAPLFPHDKGPGLVGIGWVRRGWVGNHEAFEDGVGHDEVGGRHAVGVHVVDDVLWGLFHHLFLSLIHI